MTYQEQLSPWVVHQLLPDLQRRAIARFRNRNDAEGYLKIVGQMLPDQTFVVAFDVKPLTREAPPATPPKRRRKKAIASS